MAEVSPIPEGFTSVTPHLTVAGAARAIAFYGQAFGAEEISRQAMPNDPDILMHAHIRMFGSPIMLVDTAPEWGNKDPRALGGSPVSIHLYVEDADAVFARAVAAGCGAVMPVQETFWGDRFGALVDPFGHHWSVATRVADPSTADLDAGAEEAFGGAA